MNTTAIKNFATKARRTFLKLVSDKLTVFGITESECPRGEVKGDAYIVNGIPYPAQMRDAFNALQLAWNELGYEQLVVSVSHTWFNRFCALRYMEVHEYIPFRVFPQTGSVSPDILTNAVDAAEELKINVAQVREMKLAGDKDQELYRLLLLAQCKELSKSLPFLFKAQDQYSELLLPDNLLHTDSIIFSLVKDIPEEDWQEIEIIGWLYQYYISEKKDEVIGKVVRKEDIPAATQLFTPNWIVKYMVENSLGRLWLEVNPQSNLADHMEYYIDTSEANPDYVPPKRDHIKSPEDLKVIDPACGSGHILVYAFDLLFKIYEEAGYIQREIPKKILEYNLYGLDIDERAAQLASFALMMKGREYDRRLLRVRDDNGIAPHIVEIKESEAIEGFKLTVNNETSPFADQGMLFQDPDFLSGEAQEFHPLQPDFTAIINLFKGAKNFGSLLSVTDGLKSKLPEMKEALEAYVKKASYQESHSIEILEELITQAELLLAEYDVCVANPPYMGGKVMNSYLKKFAKNEFPDFKSDLFAVSTVRFLQYVKQDGFIGLMTPFTWMFLKSYEPLRELFLEKNTIKSLIQPEYHAFFESAFVPICTFVIQANCIHDFNSTFIDLSDFTGADLQPIKTREAIENRECSWRYITKTDELKLIPGKPIAYSTSKQMLSCFSKFAPLDNITEIKLGISPGDSERFLKAWHEVSFCGIGFNKEPGLNTKNKWYPTNKGGAFRRWYGNCDYIMNWENDGDALRNLRDSNGRQISRPQNLSFQFKPHVAWTRITPSHISFRQYDKGYLFTDSAVALFTKYDIDCVIAFLNTNIVRQIAKQINPTLNYQPGDIAKIPFGITDDISMVTIKENSARAVAIAREDWCTYERAWDFQSFALVETSGKVKSGLKTTYNDWLSDNQDLVVEIQHIEEENNLLYSKLYGLDGELSPDVPVEQITLTVNPSYRYDNKISKEEQLLMFEQDTMKELISYAIGCMMGRYSLDRPGLILASQGETLEDYVTRVKEEKDEISFMADDDGIVPVLEDTYFEDDCYHRLVEFLKVTFSEDTLDENLQFLASHFKPKKNETPETTLRRYLSNQFFKDHLKTYKKRPIYWLVSSGKEKAFQCLIYMHRYTPATLSRMRTTYVRELQSKLNDQYHSIEKAIEEADSSSEKSKEEKKLTKLDKQIEELRKFDEKLRHLADKQIDIDLDDGVKHNYGLFGDLLAEVKAVTGKAPEKV